MFGEERSFQDIKNATGNDQHDGRISSDDHSVTYSIETVDQIAPLLSTFRDLMRLPEQERNNYETHIDAIERAFERIGLSLVEFLSDDPHMQTWFLQDLACYGCHAPLKGTDFQEYPDGTVYCRTHTSEEIAQFRAHAANADQDEDEQGLEDEEEHDDIEQDNDGNDEAEDHH